MVEKNLMNSTQKNEISTKNINNNKDLTEDKNLDISNESAINSSVFNKNDKPKTLIKRKF